MLSNRLAFAALATACIAAAAGGGYLASRQNAVPAPVAATSAPAVSPAPVASGPAERPVQETEAVVGDAASKPSSVPQPPAAPAVAPIAAPFAPPRIAPRMAPPTAPPPIFCALPLPGESPSR